MTRIPTPGLVAFAQDMLGLELTDYQKTILAEKANRIPPTFDNGGKKMYVDFWPDCSRCGHSCTGVYAGKPRCNRCTSSRRLNG